MYKSKRLYFYCAFMQTGSVSFRYLSGIQEMAIAPSSLDFLSEFCLGIASKYGEPDIANKLTILSLNRID